MICESVQDAMKVADRFDKPPPGSFWDDIADDPYGPKYYSRSGKPISLRQWMRAFENFEGRQVAESTVVTVAGNVVWISTVWLGLDHGFMPGRPPVIFETMAFPEHEDSGEFSVMDLECYRWRTEEQAFRGHEAMCGKYAQDWWLDLGGRA